MSNSYFQFKQFRIEQDKTAMKVCTDSCIFGASIDPQNANTILDIGTGTGLLALMMAQKSEATIDAVEIEESAFLQAQQNIQQSKWNDRIKLYHQSIQDFILTKSGYYDLIISNPPFYSKQLKSPNLKKNIAHHSEDLSLEELVNSVRALLKTTGRFYLILPEAEFNTVTSLLLFHNLHLTELITIKDRAESPVFRVIGCFEFEVKEQKKGALNVKNETGDYSSEFKELLKEYYLHL